jgi:hypothetical protein
VELPAEGEMKAQYIIHMDSHLRQRLDDVALRSGLTELELTKVMLKLILVADALEQKGQSLMVKDDSGEIVPLEVFGKFGKKEQ